MQYSSGNWRIASILCACAATLLLLAGCSDDTPRGQAVSTVYYQKIEPRPETLTIELPGRTSAFKVAEVRPQVTGIILQRLFTEGANVEEGQILYQIDPAPYQAAYDSAAASLQRAEANVRSARALASRYRSVLQANAVSKQEYDNAVAASGQAEADVAAAKASLQTARINLDYTRVTAPVSGRIGASSVTEGALVTQNQVAPLATIQQLDTMYVDVTQSSAEILRLRRALNEGRLVRDDQQYQVQLVLEDGTLYSRQEMRIDAETGRPVTNPVTGRPMTDTVPIMGTLQFSDVTVEQSTGALTIRAIFPNPDDLLLPGMYVRAILQEGVREQAILIPQKTVIRDNKGQATVRVLTPSREQPDLYTVELRVLELDRSIGNAWLVNSGLNPGDLLVSEGLQKAAPGTLVRAQPETAMQNNEPADPAAVPAAR